VREGADDLRQRGILKRPRPRNRKRLYALLVERVQL